MKVVANQGASQTQMLAISPLRFFAMVVCASLGRAVAQVNLARAGQAKVPRLAIVETVTPQCSQALKKVCSWRYNLLL